MLNPTTPRCEFILICLSLLAFATSLFLPVVPDKDGHLFGYEAFYFSMLSVLSSSSTIAFPPPFLLWCANVSWLLGVFFFFKGRIGWSVSLGCISALLSSLWLHKALMLGYYVWLASMYLLLSASVIQGKCQSQNSKMSSPTRRK